MRVIAVLVAAGLALAGLVSPASAGPVHPAGVAAGSSPVAAAVGSGFVDVPAGAPFFAEITWLAQEGITLGSVQPDGSVVFDPAGPVRREAMAAFLYRFAGSPAFTPPATSPFVDVPTSYVFYKEIAWLADQGISTGTVMGDGSREFRPAEAVSREALAAFLYRVDHRGSVAAGAFGACASGSPFPDVPADLMFCEAIRWMASVGPTPITNGRADGTFGRSAPATREAMAAYLYRFRLDKPVPRDEVHYVVVDGGVETTAGEVLARVDTRVPVGVVDADGLPTAPDVVTSVVTLAAGGVVPTWGTRSSSARGMP